MCGIAGFIQRAGTERAMLDELARRLTDPLAPRGPDGSGHWIERHREAWDVVLGHRRLSIIDPQGGAQPLHESGGVWHITYNGELFNFRELRAQLEAKGHDFQTRSDTEVVLQQVAATGVDGLAALNGMFAFALWDSRQGRLLLARDRAGIKPLYYCELPGGGIAFASELTALLRHPAAPRRLSRDGVREYFFADAIHPPRTAIDGVRKLPPGTTVLWEDGVLGLPRPFWRLQPSPPIAVSAAEAQAELERLLQQSVRRQLVADVPVGVFLSGGVDSSLIAALAARETAGPLHTFSIGFAERDLDESGHARRVAGHLGTRHTEEVVGESALLASLDAALGALDEPMADPSMLATWMLARLAARHVKVVLGGDGGDELWAGYPTYRAHRLADVFARIPAPVRRGIVAPLVARLPVDPRYQSFEWKAKRFVLRFDDDRARRHLRWMSSTDLPDLRRLLGESAGEPALLGTAAAAPPWSDALNALLALDFSTYMTDSVLTKVDRASMAHGLEVRPPMLDNEVIDLAFSLPGRVKLRGARSKYLLKRVASAYLPAAIVHRPKQGFAIPLARWLRGSLRERVDAILAAGSARVWTETGLSRAVLSAWAREPQSGRRDHARPLWALVVLDHWLRRL